MAVLDPRLLPLLGALADTGADWLAFEIVEGVRRGRESLEPEGILKVAREKVRSRQQSDRFTTDVSSAVEPILGDEQIVWAADYVVARLEGALADLDAGYATMKAVAEAPSDTFEEYLSSFSKARVVAPLQVALIGQDGPPIDQLSIDAAKKGIESLREALAQWLLEVKDEAD